jgi:hypothetical protein
MDHLMYTIEPLIPTKPTWDMVYQIIENTKEEPGKKILWKAAVDFLYAEFGKGFFDTCGHNHPVSHKLTIDILALDDLIEFADTLKMFKRADGANYSILLKKLKPRVKCQTEGIPFYDLARKFSAQEFDVKFLIEKKDNKTPDIELIDRASGESIFVEVSQLKQSLIQESIQTQHRQISNTFLHYGYDLPKACKQLQPLKGEEMNWIIQKIKLIKDKAAKDEEFVAFENDFIKMAAAHPGKLQELDEWCAQRNMRRNSMEGLQVYFNDTRRLVENRKIERKIKQLPVTHAGYVHIPVSFLYFLSMDTPDTAISIMDQLIHYPHCIGVGLYASSRGSLIKDGIIEVENIWRSVKTDNAITRHTLFIGNPYFNKGLLPQSFNKFQKALM